MWRNKGNLVEPRSVKAYLLISIRRKLVRYMSKYPRKQHEPDQGRVMEVVYCREEQIVQDQLRHELKTDIKQALNSLSRRQREAIYLKFYLNLSYKEIASTMEININSIYNLISKAIDILQDEIKRTEKMRL